MRRRTRLNIGILVLFLSIWGLGAWGFIVSQKDECCAPKVVFSAAYKSLQMFGLNFDLEARKAGADSKPGTEAREPATDEKVVEWPLQIARFLAPGFSALSAILLISRQWRVGLQILLQIAWFWRPRVIVFGYGPVGRAIARRFSATRTVTAVDLDPDGARQTAASEDGVLFVEGDGSDLAVIRRIRLRRSTMIFVAYDEDVVSLDVGAAIMAYAGAAEAHTTSQPGKKLDVRLILKSHALARDLADSQLSKLNNLNQTEIFVLPEMAAVRLCETARFDRVALEAKQARAHVVIIGCGALGEAIVNEVLLTAWRIALSPPKVTIFDRSIAAVKSSMASVAPALFIGPGQPGALPEKSAPTLDFHEIDLDNCSISDLATRLCALPAPATAYVVATGDDAANLRTALLLERATLRRQLPVAPIHVRLSNKYRGDTADLGTSHIGLVSPFGSLESVIASGRAFDADPDLVPRTVHRLYKEAKKVSFPDEDEVDWPALSPTYKAANRRLYRHSVQKLEDLNLHPNALHREEVRIKGPLSANIDEARQKMEARYSEITDKVGNALTVASSMIERIERSIVLEHNRWMTERALEGWRAAASSEREDRDDDRRHQNFICPWSQVNAKARKYDALLIWALTLAASHDAKELRERKVGRVWLSLDRQNHTERWIASMDFAAEDVGLTELDVRIAPVVHGLPESTLLLSEAARRLMDLGSFPACAHSLVRIRFGLPFSAPDAPLQVVQIVSEQAGKARIETTVQWFEKANRPFRIGFVGHRNLSRAGDVQTIEKAIEKKLREYAFEHPDMRLVSGFAAGADQLAVSVWNRMGLGKPTLVMPFVENRGQADECYWTDTPNTAGAQCFRKSDLEPIGAVVLAERKSDETEHQAQSRHILEEVDVLIAVWDGDTNSDQVGGTADSIRLARSRAIPVEFCR